MHTFKYENRYNGEEVNVYAFYSFGKQKINFKDLFKNPLRQTPQTVAWSLRIDIF